ncbi:MAG: glycosyltransferase family 4 protein [Candidatus Pacebacteria bacterium]|nr:glycosyltransferase family 4 protein [Candidatus Paceibacterota bacterium]
MTKLLITTGIFPPDIGGPAAQIEYLASDLVNAGFKVTVLTYGSPEKKERNFKLVKVSRKLLPGLKQLIFGIKVFYLAYKSEVIYTTDLYSPGYWSMLAAKILNRKFVARFAGDSAWETAVNSGQTNDDIVVFQDKKYNSFIEKRKKQRANILKSADAIVAVSNFMKHLAMKIGVEESKIKVIYNAVDFLPDIPKYQEPAAPTLTFVGRLTPWKGVEMLVRVMAELKLKYKDIMLEVLGEGSEFENLKNLAENLGLKDNVMFRGRVSKQEALSILSRSTVFVLNTNYEGLPHTVLEAMSVGAPVITTLVGGNPEVVKDEENGFLLPYNDKRAWVGAIDRLLGDKGLRNKFSQNGLKTLEKFKWNELLSKTIEVLK